jgi:hypothetical protein
MSMSTANIRRAIVEGIFSQEGETALIEALAWGNDFSIRRVSDRKGEQASRILR